MAHEHGGDLAAKAIATIERFGAWSSASRGGLILSRSCIS
jgi:hypothetical protein